MATIRQAITLQDRMSPVLSRIMTAMRSTISVMEQMNAASAAGIDSSAINRATREINNAERALRDFQETQDQIPPGTENVRRGFASWQAAIVTANQALSLVRSGINGILKLTSISDDMTNTSARLNLINDGLQTQAELQQMIYESAQRSHGAYAETANAVAQLNLLAANAFPDNKQAIVFAETMQKAFTVSGADISAQNAAMRQMSQALASGRLQGDEYVSIRENAPLIMNAIQEEMGLTNAALKEAAANGEITADVIKRAVFNNAEEINQMFSQMPITFGAAMQMIKNTAMMEFQPVSQKFSELINNTAFQQLVTKITSGIALIASGVLWLFNAISNNWDTISSVLLGAGILIGGVVAALGIYNGVIAISSFLTTAQAVASGVLAVARGGEASATALAAAEHWKLNIALLANPWTWIVIGIIAIVAAIAVWIKHVGGIKVAWLIMVNAVLTAWDGLKIAFFTGVYWVLDLIGKLQLGWLRASTGIANIIGNMKVKVLTLLQNMINGAIDIINDFIGVINKIPGVSVEAIEKVTFATTAKAEETAAQNARAEDLKAAEAELAAAKASRDASLASMRAEAQANRNAREAEIQQVKASKAEEKAAESWDWESMLGAAQAANDAAIAGTGAFGSASNPSGGKLDSVDSVGISDEDLRYLRDIAEVDYINKYTTLRPIVQANFGDVHETADVNQVLTVLENMVSNVYASSLARG